MKIRARIPTPAMSPATIPAIVAALRLFRLDPLGEFVDGLESILGIAAIAGVDVGEDTLGKIETVEGIGQGFFSTLPHNSGFPENDLLSWLPNRLVSGISPLKLLNERSIVAFTGILFVN